MSITVFCTDYVTIFPAFWEVRFYNEEARIRQLIKYTERYLQF
jgi:hypothetical protein